ncbi:hypothetical protein M8368_25220, partial [Enterobacter kobei]|nr:hypothetical protein [Enterobacter kobei]
MVRQKCSGIRRSYLVGCSIPSPVQKAQRVKVDPLRSLNMEA